MKSERGKKKFAISRLEIRHFLRLPIPVLLVLTVCLFHSGTVTGQQITFESLEQKVLDRIKEARGHARQERYSRALSDLRTAVALAEKADQARLTLALALHNMAEVYRLQGKSLDAVKAYRQALRIYTELDHQAAIAITKTQINAMHGDSGKMQSGKANIAPSALRHEKESQLGRIDAAVERIRQRLGSMESKPTRSVAPSSMAPGSVQLSRTSPRASRGAYADSVKRTVTRGWRYPPSAKSKHQEGSVEVELAILSDGELESVEILQSSGFLLLDMESIRSIREAAPFGANALPKEQQQMTLRLLFNYQLPDPSPTRLKERATRPTP